MSSLIQTEIPGLHRRQGKVRDVYDLGDRLALVATDRISAFDWILPNGIPDKGRILTGISKFWFERVAVPHHVLSYDLDDLPARLDGRLRAELEGRTVIVRKTRVFPFECVVRAYISGSGWKEYRQHQTICGERLPAGLTESDRLPEPIFTPATKAESGHDENVSFDHMATTIGREDAERLRSLSLAEFEAASAHAESQGLILADTKLEWGRDPESGEIRLIDEIFTPDSSRYWERSAYRAGGPQPSFDKQFVRDWLETTGWDKASPPPELPGSVIEQTRAKYVECFERITQQPFPYR